jgi:alkanesulfonate monooxygenase SsuD/methylene tetrahydromethanopterin reductase-like flavin-dependent oxidoreductase (luciferase family)
LIWYRIQTKKTLQGLMEVSMKIGIALPSAFLNVPGSLIREWARLADEGPFSSLVVPDRLAYRDLDQLMTLAVAAGETQRIRLLTSVLVAPLHDASVLAKQTASLDVLSNGRLTLGLGVGIREDDFRAASSPYHNRGKRFEQQLEVMTRLWAGQPLDEQTGPIGPSPVQPGGPEILLGAFAPAAAEQAWQSGGRPGKPRLVSDAFFGFGPDAASRSAAYILDYHAPLGPMAQQMAENVIASPEDVRAKLKAFEELGTDEVLFIPCIPELDQVRRLIDCLA